MQPWFHSFLATILGKFVQRVDGHENDVAIQVDEFDHLLHGAVDTGAQQAAEFAYAVIFVHNVVTHFNLAQFLERKGQFSATRTVALEVVLVETVENLVVGEHAQMQIFIDKSLVHSAQHRLELDIVFAVVEDDTQTLNLFFAVAQNEDSVAFFQKTLKRVADEVEILVIDALWRAV